MKASSIRSRAAKGRVGLLLTTCVLTALALSPMNTAAAPAEIRLATAAERQQTVAALEAESDRKRSEAAVWAAGQNQPLRFRKNGRQFELSALGKGDAPLFLATDNVNAAISTGASLVRDTAPYSVNGSGWTVGVWDAGSALTSHQEFGGRVVSADGAVDHEHATHVIGTVASAGVEAAALGMAPSVSISSYDWISDESEMAAAAAVVSAEPGKIPLSNHSYGYGMGWEGNVWYGYWGEPEDYKFGCYMPDTRTWDEIAHNAPYYLIFNSAGNDRDDSAPAAGAVFYYYDTSGSLTNGVYNAAVHPLGDSVADSGFDTMGATASAKNIMTVGAVNDAVSGGLRSAAAGTMSTFSGWGPTDDGRIKPDIVANGVGLYSSLNGSAFDYGSYSGTSMSSPNAAGTALLVQEYFADSNAGQWMRSATLKGLLIHTADDLGNAGPDYSYGWGLINAQAACDVIADDTGSLAGIFETELNSSVSTVDITFSSTGVEELRATLCWTDPPGVSTYDLDSTVLRLVNDLDLRIYGPDGTEYPFVLDPANPAVAAVAGDNTRDNVEQILISAPTAGAYTLTVSHKGTLTDSIQEFSLILSGHAAAEDFSVLPADDFVSAGEVGGPFSPDYRLYDLQNNSGSDISWTCTKSADWLDLSSSGGLLSAGEFDSVIVSLNANADALPVGIHTDTLVFHNIAGGAAVLRDVVLEITDAAEVFLSFPMDSDPGWSTDGMWAFGQPLGLDGDPSAGYTGSSVYGYNLAGAYSNNLATTEWLISSAFDCSGHTDVKLTFQRWLGIESASFDHAYILLSNDGSTWTSVWTNAEDTIVDGSWQETVYDIAAFADGQSSVWIAWGLGSTDSSVTYCGWNIDDVELSGTPIPPQVDHFDWNPSGAVQTLGAAFPVTITARDSTSALVPGFTNTVSLSGLLSGGGSVAVSPAMSGAFSNGIWSGMVTVQETADDMYLRADDGAGHTGDSGIFDVIAGGGSGTGDALYFDQSADFNYGETALTNLGFNTTTVTDFTVFQNLLNTGSWEIVVAEVYGAGFPSNAAADVAAYAAAGGKMLFHYWDMDGSYDAPAAATLRDAFGAAAATDIFTPMDIYPWDAGHPVFTTPNTVATLTVAGDYGGSDNGDRMEPAAGASALGGFTAAETTGEGAIILGNEGRTILNSFSADDMNDVVPLLENEIAFLTDDPGGPVNVRLLGTTGSGSTASVLVELDADSGALLDTIGSVGYVVNGLEYDAVSGRLFATTSNMDPVFPSGLIEIDMATGAGTPIGAAGMLVNNPTVNSAGELFGWTESGDDLVSIDPATGIAAVIGESGIGTARHGLAFDGMDNLFLINSGGAVFSMDTLTGAALSVTNLGQTAHHGDFDPVSGLYYGIDAAGSGIKNLVAAQITASSAAVLEFLPTVDNLHTLTFVEDGSGPAGVLLVSDSNELTGVEPFLEADGHVVTSITNEWVNGSANLMDLSYLQQFGIVIWGASAGGYGDLHDPAVHTTLEAYIQGGGNLLVTGYDTLASPVDTNMANLVRSTTTADIGESSLTTLGIDHFILNGPAGDFRNTTIVPGYGDWDGATADTGAGAISLASFDGSAYDAIIYTDIPAGGSVGYWTGGDGGPLASDGKTDWKTPGDSLDILRNWVFGIGGGSAPVIEADLEVGMVDDRDPAYVLEPYSYLLTVYNYGPDDASGVVVTNTLPAGSVFLSASSVHGTWSRVGSEVIFDIGAVSVGGSVDIEVEVAGLSGGALTNSAVVAGNEADPVSGNDVAVEMTSVIPGVDSDGDGIMDWWEQNHGQPLSAMDETTDSDGDGMSDLEEWIAFSSPVDSNSIFEITSTTNVAAGHYMISWNAAPGREYDVYWSSNLISGFELLAQDLVFPQNSYTDTVHAAEDDSFYKVKVHLEGGHSVSTGNIGYYEVDVGEGSYSQTNSIITAGYTPVNITGLTAGELAGIDVLYVQNASGAFSSEWVPQQAVIENAVSAGMVLIVHDRAVTGTGSYLPGGSSISLVYSGSADVNVLDSTTMVTSGPGGTVDDTTLDGGSWSTHGYAALASLPAGAVPILSHSADPSYIVTFAYPYGSGWVVYSTIPLDYYLKNPASHAGLDDIYAPNVVAYGASLAP